MSSPSVTLKEEDLSSFVQSYSASQAAFAGDFSWGPIDYPYLISNGESLSNVFGVPTRLNNTSFYNALSYLDYSDNLLLVRSAGANAKNATNKMLQTVTIQISNVSSNFIVGEEIQTSDEISATIISVSATEMEVYNESGQITSATTISGVTSGATATVVSADPSYRSMNISNISGTVSVGDSITGGTSSAEGTIVAIEGNELIYTLSNSTDFSAGESVVTSTSATFDVVDVNGIKHYFVAGTRINNINDFELLAQKNFMFAARYAGTLGNSIKVSVATSSTFNSWAYKQLFDSAPGENELHIVVIDVDGKFYNSTPNAVLQTFAYLSTISTAKNENGENVYYKTKINSTSPYIYAGDNQVEAGDFVLANGVDDAPADSDIINSYKLFNSSKGSDVFYMFTGLYNATVDNAVIALAEENMKNVVFTSPVKSAVTEGSNEVKVDSISSWANSITTSNHTFLDCNWRQVYDSFNNDYIWVPCCSATCGLNSRCDTNNNVWVSPMGYTRGIYLNTTKLAWEPEKGHRDTLYKISVNPIFTDGADGIVLLGDRTHTIKPSYFRQLAVRKTLIVIEQSALNYLKYFLGENNNTQTRALATSQITKFLRDLGAQGAFRRAQVICNETNNTEQVIDEQKMRCLIRIQPQSSINYIELTVSVVNSVAQFTENVINGTL